MNELTNVTREGGRLAVPASLFVDGVEPPFALFDRRGRLADLAIARTVYVAPSDAEALSTYERRQLGALMGARRVPEPARAWALHRALLEVGEHALRHLPEPDALLRRQPGTAGWLSFDCPTHPTAPTDGHSAERIFMKRATTQLRALGKAGKFLELPAEHDPLTARLPESDRDKNRHNHCMPQSVR